MNILKKTKNRDTKRSYLYSDLKDLRTKEVQKIPLTQYICVGIPFFILLIGLIYVIVLCN